MRFLNTGSANTDGRVDGTVLLADGTPGAFATVQVRGTQNGTTADKNGNFTLTNVTPGKHELQISMIGYESVRQSITVEKNKIANFSTRLSAASNQLNEVVVTGQYEPQSLKKISL